MLILQRAWGRKRTLAWHIDFHVAQSPTAPFSWSASLCRPCQNVGRGCSVPAENLSQPLSAVTPGYSLGSVNWTRWFASTELSKPLNGRLARKPPSWCDASPEPCRKMMQCYAACKAHTRIFAGHWRNIIALKWQRFKWISELQNFRSSWKECFRDQRFSCRCSRCWVAKSWKKGLFEVRSETPGFWIRQWMGSYPSFWKTKYVPKNQNHWHGVLSWPIPKDTCSRNRPQGGMIGRIISQARPPLTKRHPRTFWDVDVPARISSTPFLLSILPEVLRKSRPPFPWTSSHGASCRMRPGAVRRNSIATLMYRAP